MCQKAANYLQIPCNQTINRNLFTIFTLNILLQGERKDKKIYNTEEHYAKEGPVLSNTKKS